jgi:hypothetical protein
VAGRNPSEAVRFFVAPLQRALGCFLSGKVTADTFEEGPEGIVTLNRGDPVRLDGDQKLNIEVSLRYTVVRDESPERGPWKVRTLGWMHELTDANGSELAAWHWHPVSESHVMAPHLHVPTAPKLHFPTGRIMVEDVLNFALCHGAEPRDPAAWEVVDRENREAFRRGATWGLGPSGS